MLQLCEASVKESKEEEDKRKECHELKGDQKEKKSKRDLSHQSFLQFLPSLNDIFSKTLLLLKNQSTNDNIPSFI